MLQRLKRSGWLVALALTSCPADELTVTESPEAVFESRGVDLEERRGERVLWVGTASTGSGDLNVTELTDVALTRRPQQPGEGPIRIRAPKARLNLEKGRANFSDVVITDDEDASLSAGTAVYNEEKQRIVARGPLDFQSGALEARAERAVVRIDENRVDFEGPITGRFDPAKQAPPAAAP